jgi:hypothetical protein
MGEVGSRSTKLDRVEAKFIFGLNLEQEKENWNEITVKSGIRGRRYVHYVSTVCKVTVAHTIASDLDRADVSEPRGHH